MNKLRTAIIGMGVVGKRRRYFIEKKSNYINNYLTNKGIVGNQKKIVEIVEKYIENINYQSK